MSIAWASVAAPEPMGRVGIGVTEAGLALVSFGAREHQVAAAARGLGVAVVADPARTDPVAAQLAEYFAGRRREFAVPLDWRLARGSQERVLRTLFERVGYGQTTTYGELARDSGAFTGSAHNRAFGARAVGAIMGANPLPVIVPCHRVLAADGLGGFGGGLPTKRRLLELEGALQPALFP